MYNHNPKLGSARKNGFPFICRLVPFVGKKNSAIRPFVSLNMPFIRNSGLTMVELIIVLTIAGVLAALAAPGMQRIVASNRLTTQVNDLLADLNFTRSEAIKRNTTTGICVTASGGTTCAAGGNWANGWLVYFVCPTTDPSCAAGTNVTVKMHETLSGSNTLTGPADAVIYSKSGFLSSGTGSFTLCDPALGKRRVVTLAATGRPILSEGTCP